MNVAKLMLAAVTDHRRSGLRHAVRVGFAAWMYCGHHAGTIWDRVCFANGLKAAAAAFRGKL